MKLILRFFNSKLIYHDLSCKVYVLSSVPKAKKLEYDNSQPSNSKLQFFKQQYWQIFLTPHEIWQKKESCWIWSVKSKQQWTLFWTICELNGHTCYSDAHKDLNISNISKFKIFFKRWNSKLLQGQNINFSFKMIHRDSTNVVRNLWT